MKKDKTWELYWDKKEKNFLELYKNEEFIEDAISEIEKHLQKRGLVLDLGCGDGVKTDCIAKKGFKVVGLDISETAIKKAKKNFKGIHFITGDIANAKLPFKPNLFDAVIAISLLEYIKNKKKFFKKVKKILKSGGLLITITPNSNSLTIKFGWRFLMPFFSIFKKEYKQSYCPFNKKEFFDLTKKEGFNLLKIDYLPITYLILPKILRPIFKNIGKIFKEEVVIILRKN